MKQFIKDDLEFHLPEQFKGLKKDYILSCIFDDDIQSKWIPEKGDIMVGCTGNVWVISNIEKLYESLGGDRYYFGGNSCNRDGGNVLNDTICFTANESGKLITWINGKLEEVEDSYHSSIKDFRFVPYPHELNRI